jgi:DNA recombination protein RmuC
VRTEFGKFGDVLARVQKKLQEASNTIEEARGKTTTIARKLRDVEGLPDNEADRLLSGSGESGRLFDENDADPPAGTTAP